MFFIPFSGTSSVSLKQDLIIKISPFGIKSCLRAEEVPEMEMKYAYLYAKLILMQNEGSYMVHDDFTEEYFQSPRKGVV